VVHCAGQTAVTTSVVDPRPDFESNALGTFNSLEAAREVGDDPIFFYTSTNKVYGGMDDVPTVMRNGRYEFEQLPEGVSELQPLDFHSPYGCSKGAADQYVRDYQRIYGLRSVVFRQSCIYGPRQMGVEDQGWVAWFVIAAFLGRPITIYGDGKQVRDVLHIDDLVRAFDLAIKHIDRTSGQVYNIGGGPQNTLAIWTEFQPLLEELLGRPVEPSTYADWRPGDQPVFVSDIRKAERDFGWRPAVSPKDGIDELFEWVKSNSDLF
jgi:CDP-paratose 2-epimerase